MILYNVIHCCSHRTLAAVLSQGEAEGWGSWKSRKCDYLFSLLNPPPRVCGCCLHLLLLPASLPSRSQLQGSVGRGSSSSIAAEGWSAWWQMGDAVSKLGWDERVAGTFQALQPLSLCIAEPTLFLGEHTCQEQPCAAPSLPHLATLKSINLLGLSVPLICGGEGQGWCCLLNSSFVAPGLFKHCGFVVLPHCQQAPV